MIMFQLIRPGQPRSRQRQKADSPNIANFPPRYLGGYQLLISNHQINLPTCAKRDIFLSADGSSFWRDLADFSKKFAGS
jgi:hypothetical protein